MNNDCTYIYFRLFTTIIIILTLTTRVSLTSTLLPIYPCHYKDLNQRIYKCDICTCQLSPPLFSTSNLCSSLSTKIPVICSDNNINTTNQLSNEQLLRSRLDEIEFETDHQWSTQYSISTKQIFNNLNFEFDYFNNDIIKNLFNFEQICSSLNNSRLTFYRLQSSLTFQQTCSLTLFSLRFLDSTIDNHQLISSTNPETLIFYNCSFSSLIDFNFTRTTTLSFYYVKFYSKPFLLKSLSTLTYLTLTHTTNFELLGSFSNLIYLDLCHTQLNDLQLNKLLTQVDMPDLTTLILSNNQITLLKTKFPSTIRYLDLSNNHIRSLDYTSFKSLYSLNTLNLSFNSPLDIQQDTFTRIPYLEVLDLTSILPSIPFDDLFLPLQKLRHLNISSNNLQILPRLPVPYDAHTIVSYDHHLPVVYVDASLNKLTRLVFDIFSSSSTQDKYIISLDLTSNQIETFQLPSLSLTTDMKRRGPLIELNLKQNPFVCDCTLYENIFSLLQQNDRPTNHQQQTNLFNCKSKNRANDNDVCLQVLV